MLISPRLDRLRLLYINAGPANRAIRWLRQVAVVAVFGSAAAELGLLLGLDAGSYRTLLRLVGLIVAGLLAAFVLRSRHAVAAHLRGEPAQAGPTHDSVRRWRRWFAGAWHYFALVVIAAGWISLAAGERAGIRGFR